MLGHKVALGAALLSALQLFIRLMSMISLVIMARLLTPADFGLVALAASVLLIASAVTELNVSDALVQRQEINTRDLDTAFTLNALRGLLVTLVILAAAEPVALIFEDRRLLPVMAVMSLIPLVAGLSSPAMVRFLLRLEYGPGARLQILAQVCGLAVSIGLAIATRSYWALIASQVTSQVISSLFSYYLAPYRPRFRIDGMRSILDFAGWMTASRIVSTVNLQSDRFLIGHLLGKSQLGQYAVGSDMSSMATYAFATPLMQTLFGGFSQIKGDLIQMRAAFLKGQQMLVIALLPLGFGTSVIAERLLPLVIGPHWELAIAAVVWMAPVVSLQVLYLPLLSLAMALRQPRVLVFREAINLAVRLPLTLISAFYYGFMGAIVMRTLSGLAIIVMTLMMAHRFIQVSVTQQITNIWRSLVSVSVMTVSVILLKLEFPVPKEVLTQIFQIVAFIVVAGLIYVFTHITLWLVSGRPDGAEKFIYSMLRQRSRQG